MTREVKLIWALVAATLVAVVVTYTRLPADELYHVSGSGLRAGLGRAVVDLNFPDALIALAVLGVVGPYLTPLGRRLAVVAAVLCAVGPAFVRQADLDVRWVNAVGALGVMLACSLTLFARVPPSPRHVRGDRLRVVLAVVLTLVALEWVAAALGFYLDVVFQSSRIVSYHDAPHHAVHHGMHHGLYGLLLVVTALLLSRLPNRISPLLALLVAYGVGNMLNDLWLEQVAERGWTSWTIPSCLEPGVTWTWLGVLLATPVIWFLWFRASAAETDAEADLHRTRSAAQPS